MRNTNGWAVLAAAVMLVAGPLAAAGSLIEDGGTSHAVAPDPTELEERARSLFSSPARYGEAARLLLKAADQREIGDPQRVKNLSMASRLTYYRGDVSEALAIMERAAAEAMSTGDVLAAARGYTDGAFLAHEIGQVKVAEQLLKKAERLSHSPLIAQSDRDEIRARTALGG